MPTRRAAAIEYAIRDVVVPALELEKMGHEIIKMNIGDPLAYPGLPTPSHMVEAFKQALDRQDNGYGPSYGIPALREAIAADERSKGWACQAQDVYVTHGVTEALQILFAAFLNRGDSILAPGRITRHILHTPKCTVLRLSNMRLTRKTVGQST